MLVRLCKDTEIDRQLLEELFRKHRIEVGRLNRLDRYFRNEPSIKRRAIQDKSKPNNKLVNNYARYITTMATGYFVGVPVKMVSNNKELLTRLEAIFKYNDEADCNTTTATNCSKFGYSYELHYLDEEGDLRFVPIDPREIIYIEENSLNREPLMAIRYYKPCKEHTIVEIYDKENITTYKLTYAALTEVDKMAHNFKDVPVIRYTNNDQCEGDYESVLSLIDAYDKTQSDSANDFEYFTDAYLKVTGTTLDPEDAEKLKELRVFNFPDADGDVSFVTKQMNDTALENYKDRLDKDIHKFSLVPNMTDENFVGNSSGVAMAYKLQGLEFMTGIKEQKFKKGLLRRVELITNILSIKMNEKLLFTDIEFVFTRNNPKDLVEIVDMATKLTGIISEEAQLEMLPMVNVEQELKRKAEEKESSMNLMTPYSFNITQEETNEQHFIN